MHEPAFWYRPSSLTSRLLMPLGASMARSQPAAGAPGSTPASRCCASAIIMSAAPARPPVLALVDLLREMDEVPVVLSRGYGGRRGPVSVDPQRQAAADVGDEPLMMARMVPVVVARDRVEGAALARSRNASVIVMDDGFQNPAVVKDAALIVIDGNRGLGNGRVFPAGPLRAPLPPQLACTDAPIIVGAGSAADKAASAIARKGRCCAPVSPEPRLPALRGKRVWALRASAIPTGFSRRTGQQHRRGRGSGLRHHHPYDGRSRRWRLRRTTTA